VTASSSGVAGEAVDDTGDGPVVDLGGSADRLPGGPNDERAPPVHRTRTSATMTGQRRVHMGTGFPPGRVSMLRVRCPIRFVADTDAC